MGITVVQDAPGVWHVDGVGVGGLHAPDDVLDLGNSGTSARLLCGLLAGHGFTAIMTGDDSLRKRPMNRVIDPLTQMGVRVETREAGQMPISFTGADMLLPIIYTLPVPSAQVKSAVLLAGLHAPGQTTVIEPIATRDHTERMLTHMGAVIDITESSEGRRITITGQGELSPASVTVPSDPSSAAFPAVAATIIPDSVVTLEGIGMNPARVGIFKSLVDMGASIEKTNPREESGEPLADLKIRGSALTGAKIPASRAASMIDEYPVLAMAAACAIGTSRFEGVGELRVKESDRLATLEAGLRACGVKVETDADSMTIEGCGGPPPGGATIATSLDHRIAMSFLVLGLATEKPVKIDDIRPSKTSFPDFAESMRCLGADIREAS
jgi:3-phosphoshikimate 1-carboxyvinyltransferase